jgi:hypothetical protein
MANEKAEQGHSGLKEAEDDGDTDAESPVNPREADADCGCKVRQAKGDGDQDDARHAINLKHSDLRLDHRHRCAGVFYRPGEPGQL